MFLLKLNTDALKDALELSWKGMLAIFLGMSAIFLMIQIISGLKRKKEI